MCVTMKFMLSSIPLQFLHLFLKQHGIRVMDLNAKTTSAESVSIHIFLQFIWSAISMALRIPESSAWKAVPPPIFSAKASLKTASESLNIPPQEEVLGVAAPSVLHFNQFWYGGCQIISLMTGAYGAWMLTLHFFRMIKSLTEDLDVLSVLLPVKEIAAMILLIPILQLKGFPWNLNWFLANQMVLMIFIIAARTTTLHCWDQDLSHSFHMSSMDWKCRLLSRTDANQHHKSNAKLH